MLLNEIFKYKSNVATENFKKWFAGSKVVDKSGRPLPVFHGTAEAFTEFKRESENRRAYGINRLGYWFDVDPETPNYFAYPSEITTPNVIVAYLSIKKPFIFTSEPVWHEDEKTLKKYADKNDYHSFNDHVNTKMDRQDSFNHMMDSLGIPETVRKSSREYEDRIEDFRNEAIESGYDGIYLPQTYADAGSRNGKLTDWWVAFHPWQIKSAIGNSGKFDPNSNNIDESK